VHLARRSQLLVRGHRGLRVRVAAGAVQRTLPIRVTR
jgi:hypothetical protein